jgi:hypothetical protein
LSESITAGVASNSLTVMDWSQWLSGNSEIDYRVLHESMIAASKKAANGELKPAEAMLMAQALSLNAIFGSLARQAHITQNFDQFDRLTRLALKTQGQCRATIETLALMKNPPVFARQANIAAGPQQINNGIARAGIQESEPNKLLEAHGERMDGCSTCETGQGDSALEAVGALDRPANTGGEETSVQKRLLRRRAGEVSDTRPPGQGAAPCSG